MGNASWSELLNNPGAGANWTAVAGTPLATSVAETIISPSAPDLTFNLHARPLQVGQVIRVSARGVYGTTGTPTLQLRLRFGGVAGTLLLDTGAVTGIATVTNASWQFNALFSCRSVGASGTIVALGDTMGLAGAATVAQVPTTGSQAPITIDTTTQKALVLTGQWGTSNSLNTVTVTQWVIEGLT